MGDGDAKFQLSLSVGAMGEKLAARWLKSCGCGVVSSSEFSGKDGNKAPKLMFSHGGLALPDLDVSKEGARSWIEIKTYTAPAWNRKYNCWVHGFPKRLFCDYVEVEKQSGTMVWIGVLELKSCALLLAHLSSLPRIWPCLCRECQYESERCLAPIKRGIYWPRDDMELCHTFSSEEIEPILEVSNER